MLHDVISTSRAADILGCSRSKIIQMINDGAITSAYMGSKDGNVGRPGYRISVTEVYEILERRESKPAVEERTNIEVKTNRDGIKDTLSDLQTCLIMLAETIGKLKDEL